MATSPSQEMCTLGNMRKDINVCVDADIKDTDEKVEIVDINITHTYIYNTDTYPY